MAVYPETLDDMLSVWNEGDTAQVSAHLDQALSEQVRFVDAANSIAGIDGFAEMICGYRGKLRQSFVCGLVKLTHTTISIDPLGRSTMTGNSCCPDLMSWRRTRVTK